MKKECGWNNLHAVISMVLIYAFLIVGAVLILFPMYMTIGNAFKTKREILHSIFSPPTSFYLENLRVAIFEQQAMRYLFNSFYTTASSTILVITVIPMLAYGIIRNIERLIFKIMFFTIVSGIFIPFQIIMLPMIKQLNYLKLLSPLGLIIMATIFGYPVNVFLYTGYLKTVPIEIEEAAIIDGCGVAKLFWSIVCALIKPMTATIIILHGLGTWNDFLLPNLLLNRDARMWTLPIFQYSFQSKFTTQYNMVYALFLFTIIPITVLYIFTQKYIIGGIVKGALKG